MILDFPNECYNHLNEQPKSMSLFLLLNPTQFQQCIMELFPRLRNNFYLYRLDKVKKMKRLPVESAADLKPHKYFGVIVVSNEQLSEPNQ